MSLIFPRSHGVLGMNARNLKYLRPFNPRRAVAFADNKLKTKVFLETRGIPVPKLYGKITSRDALRSFDFSQLPDACVLKPNYGYGGEGIIVMKRREKGGFLTASGKHVSYPELLEHIEDILDGMYSLNHRRDIAFFEQIIITDPCFAALNPSGLPDIRIIAHNLVPVMAMIRLPTEESGGKANVHMGGIALGIDLAKGVTTFGVQHNRRITKLPNGKDTAGFRVPYWDEMLLIASRIQQITNIGFIGVDLTVDEENGPMLLEVNARPGLMVQIANLAPLGKRLERVEGLKVSSPEKGVRIAQDLFGEKVVAKKPEGKETRPVLGTREYIEVLGGRKTVTVPVILQPEYDRTVFDPDLIEELKSIDAIDEADDGTLRVKILLGGKKLQTVIQSHEVEVEGVRASLGKRDLSGFLVDPSKLPPHPAVLSGGNNLERIDKQLADIDRKLQILKHIRPDNIGIERSRAEADPSYNPVFTYSDMIIDKGDLLDRLQYLEGDDSPMGQLLEKKRMEIINKVYLLQARGENELFTEASGAIFDMPTPGLVREARSALKYWNKVHEEVDKEDLLSAADVQAAFQKVLAEYGLRDWRVALKSQSVVDCSIGRKSIILRTGATFTQERVNGLIAHEIETHVLTAENGAKQPYQLFERGCAGYLETQEGLAMYREHKVISPNHEKLFWPALGVLAIHYGLSHSFADLRSYIKRLGFDDSRALRTCLTVKRGMRDTGEPGAFTKGLVYFRGKQLVERYLEQGGDMKELFRGKINIRDMDLIRKVEGMIEPVYIPKDVRTEAED